jgi:hypothetical protein
LSKSLTFDTIYGASWSPDGKQLAFGCADYLRGPGGPGIGT